MKSHNIDDGQVINIGSISGYYVPYVDPPVLNMYSSSKFCLRSVTETLRRELRYYKSKIRTTYIAPGLVATDLLAVDDSSDTDGIVSDEIPMLKSEDVADVCAFVLSTQPHCQLPEIVMRVVGEEI
nr:dehydrogenase/reductase SDR family member 11-like [Onthophagus taurus]